MRNMRSCLLGCAHLGIIRKKEASPSTDAVSTQNLWAPGGPVQGSASEFSTERATLLRAFLKENQHAQVEIVRRGFRACSRCVYAHDAERSAEVGRLRPDPDDPAARHPNPDRHSDRRLRLRSELNRLSAAALRHNGAPDQPRIDTAPSGAVFFVVRSATSP